MKKITSLVLAVLLLLSVGMSTALAAKPSAQLISGSKYVRRGSTMKAKFRLKCGSYTKLSGQYRACFVSFINRGSASGRKYASKTLFFTGNANVNITWKVPKSVPTGKYVNLYGTYYKAGRSWYVNSAKTSTLYIY